MVNAYTLANLPSSVQAWRSASQAGGTHPSTKRANEAPSTAQAMRMGCTDGAALSDQLTPQ